MENGEQNDKALFYLGKIKPEELQENFDKIYDGYKSKAEKKGLGGDIKFVESLDCIYIYAKIN
jgi:hypothetical protein